MVRLNATQLEKKKKFISDYMKAQNAADGSTMDSNANVSNINVATLSAELNKDINIQINRSMIYDKIFKLHGAITADEYIRQIEKHEIYVHDETSILPYCTSVSLYPFLLDGLKGFGGESSAPKHLSSFNGGFINLVFALASQFAGACLHKDQELILKNDKNISSTKVVDLVNKFDLNNSFSNYQGNWEYSNISDENISVWENGKFVKVTKVYRRKYDKNIYKIYTKSGKSCRVSEDHIFKVMFRGREIEVKTKDLSVNDTVFNTEWNKLPLNKSSQDYMDGQFYGIIAGDGNITQDTQTTVSLHKKQKHVVNFLDTYTKNRWEKSGTIHNCERHEKQNWVSYYVGSTKITSEIREMFNGIYSDEKNIDISNKSLDFLAGFLDGVLVTDGNFGHNISISLTSEKLIDNIVGILGKFNMNTSKRKIPGYTRDFDNATIKDIWVCNISSLCVPYLSLFSEQHKNNKKYNNINTENIYYYGKHAFKKAKSNSTNIMLVSASNQKNTSTCHYDVITDIELFDNDDEYVYEIETESHWYSAGGILTHNCATVEYLMYFDHFARKEYGDDYIDSHTGIITQELQQVVYALNQPAAARGFQSVFWNISVYDKPYFEAMFNHFVFPDGDTPRWETVDKLQRFFMTWFNKERSRAVLTFPVVTAACLNDGNSFIDTDYKKFLSKELSEGNSFFVFTSDSAYALASCCRLKNDVSDQINDFSYSLGAGGVQTGSMNVITVNINRLIQDGRDIEVEIEKIHKYQLAFKDLFQEYLDNRMLPAYDGGFITLDKQYLTIGVNGVVEAAEYLGYEINNNQAYKDWVSGLLKQISDLNKVNSKKYNVKFNTEFVPAENLGAKFASWDKKDGYKVNRECYNSYLYKVEDSEVSILDKFSLHGKDTSKYLDGGSAYHCNLEEYPTPEAFEKLMDVAVKEGCEYYCFNIKVTVCDDCGFIDKRTNMHCTKCNSKNIEHATRIIGYLKKVTDFSSIRKKEEALRFYNKKAV